MKSYCARKSCVKKELKVLTYLSKLRAPQEIPLGCFLAHFFLVFLSLAMLFIEPTGVRK